MAWATEADCTVCSDWPDKDKDLKRSELDSIPAQDPICKVCFLAFWENITGQHVTEEELDEVMRDDDAT